MARSILLLLLLAFAGVGAAMAQDAPDVVVVVRTNVPDALLYAGDRPLGPAGRGVFRLPAGAAELRLVPPGVADWSVAPVRYTLAAAAGDTVEVRLDFPYHYRIDSFPHGAEVLATGDDGPGSLGRTPLLLVRDAPLTAALQVERPGYLSARMMPGREVWNRHTAVLTPVASLPEAASNEVAWSPPPRPRRWIDAAALGAAAAAGALAVHYKFKANRRYERYELTGDPSLRDAVGRYDTLSGISLGVMQVGLGVFALRLALR